MLEDISLSMGFYVYYEKVEYRLGDKESYEGVGDGDVVRECDNL